jgi:hypothetical protein
MSRGEDVIVGRGSFFAARASFAIRSGSHRLTAPHNA